MDKLDAQMLTGTDGATFPFWSPDSRSLAFFADNKLKTIDLSEALRWFCVMRISGAAALGDRTA